MIHRMSKDILSKMITEYEERMEEKNKAQQYRKCGTSVAKEVNCKTIF